jgi:hypothetical protein
MTFFGSSANDASFNAYITDITTSQNRGKVESVLAVLPLISMLIIFGGFDSMTKQGHWSLFFGIFGGAVTFTGIIAVFLVKDSHPEAKKEPFLKNLIAGFRPKVVRGNPNLYLALVAFCLFSIAVQIYFPYLIIYLQNYLKFDNYAILLGIVLILASVVSVIGGRFIDRVGKTNFMLPAGCDVCRAFRDVFFTFSTVRRYNGYCDDEWVHARDRVTFGDNPRLHATGSSRRVSGNPDDIRRDDPNDYRPGRWCGRHREQWPYLYRPWRGEKRPNARHLSRFGNCAGACDSTNCIFETEAAS